MKKYYNSPEFELIRFKDSDIIITSVGEGDDDFPDSVGDGEEKGDF